MLVSAIKNIVAQTPLLGLRFVVRGVVRGADELFDLRLVARNRIRKSPSWQLHLVDNRPRHCCFGLANRRPKSGSALRLPGTKLITIAGWRSTTPLHDPVESLKIRPRSPVREEPSRL